MKRTICIIMAFMLLAAVLSACQATPDEPIVIQKDMEQMIEKAQEISEQPTENALGGRLGVPEKYIAQNVYSDKFIMTADAEIVLPDVSTIPTVRVKPADFSQETVNRLYEYLVGDTVMYEAQPIRTKVQIEEDILWWKQILADENSSPEGKAQAEEKIERLNGAYKTAPETVQYVTGNAIIKTLSECDFETGKELYTYQGVDLVEKPKEKPENQGMYFQVHQNNTGDEIIKEENVGGFSVTDTASRGARFVYGDYDLLKKALGGELGWSIEAGKVTQKDWEQAAFKYGDFSPSKAETFVNDLLTYISADNIAVSSIEMNYNVSEAVAQALNNGAPQEYDAVRQDFLNGKRSSDIIGVTYIVNCVRRVADVEVTSNDALSSYLDDAYGKQWYYERIRIGVCKDGIFSVDWTSPHDITETLTDDTNMLPFSEIEKIIEQMFRVKWEPAGEEACEYNITKVVLSLRRVMEQDNVERGLFIPVWDLYGTCSFTYPGEPPLPGNNDQSFLTINAIDGSVIDLNKGY